MNKREMAIHNRISSKCHAYVKNFLPEVYPKLVAQATSDYERNRFRRTSPLDLQKALKGQDSSSITPPENYWGDPEISTTSPPGTPEEAEFD